MYDMYTKELSLRVDCSQSAPLENIITSRSLELKVTCVCVSSVSGVRADATRIRRPPNAEALRYVIQRLLRVLACRTSLSAEIPRAFCGARVLHALPQPRRSAASRIDQLRKA